MIVEAIVCSAVGIFAGWHFHRLYVRQMWRIQRSMKERAQGRR